jgi:hemolysin III
MTTVQRPRLRGVFHEWAFFLSLGAAGLLLVLAGTAREAVASSVYVAALAAMFGASALYHRVTWSAPVRAWMRRLDHSTIFLFIAGTYTPFALLAVGGTLGWAVLGVVWAGALAGMLLSLAWIGAPKWLAAIVYLALGWVGVIVTPQLVSGAGVAAAVLVAVGGVLYTTGAVAYATKRPNRWPSTFGYHELFHVLVVAAAAVQFVAVALVVG